MNNINSGNSTSNSAYLDLIIEIIHIKKEKSHNFGDHAIKYRSNNILSNPCIIATSTNWNANGEQLGNNDKLIYIKELIDENKINKHDDVHVMSFHDIVNQLLDYQTKYNAMKSKYVDSILSSFGVENIKDYPLTELRTSNTREREISKLFKTFFGIINRDKNGFYVVTADFGGGKTFFCQHLLLHKIANEKLSYLDADKRIPILISAENYSSRIKASQLIEIAFHEYGFTDLSFPDIKRLQQNGMFTIIFDSIDQISSYNKQGDIVDLLSVFSDLAKDKGQVIITCREDAFNRKYEALFNKTVKKHEVYSLLNFTADDITTCLKGYDVTPEIIQNNYSVLKKPIFLALAVMESIREHDNSTIQNPFSYSEYKLLEANLESWLAEKNEVEKMKRIELLAIVFHLASTHGRNGEFNWTDIEHILQSKRYVHNNDGLLQGELDRLNYFIKTDTRSDSTYKFKFPILLEFLHIYLSINSKVRQYYDQAGYHNEDSIYPLRRYRMTVETIDLFVKYWKDFIEVSNTEESTKNQIELHRFLQENIEHTANKEFYDVNYQGSNAASILFEIKRQTENFKNTMLQEVNTCIDNINFKDTVLHEVQANNIILDSKFFTGSDLDGANFSGTSLNGVVFDNAKLNNIIISNYGGSIHSCVINFNSSLSLYVLVTSTRNILFLNNELQLINKYEISYDEIVGLDYTISDDKSAANIYICDIKGGITSYRATKYDTKIDIELQGYASSLHDKVTAVDIIGEPYVNNDTIISITQSGTISAYPCRDNSGYSINILDNDDDNIVWRTSIKCLRTDKGYKVLLGNAKGRLTVGLFSNHGSTTIDEQEIIQTFPSPITKIIEIDAGAVLILCENPNNIEQHTVYVTNLVTKESQLILENINSISLNNTGNNRTLYYVMNQQVYTCELDDTYELQSQRVIYPSTHNDEETYIIQNSGRILNVTYSQKNLIFVQHNNKVIIFNFVGKKIVYQYSLFIDCKSLKFNGATQISSKTLVYLLSHGAVIPAKSTLNNLGISDETFDKIDTIKGEFFCSNCLNNISFSELSAIKDGNTYCSNCTSTHERR